MRGGRVTTIPPDVCRDHQGQAEHRQLRDALVGWQRQLGVYGLVMSG
jgi:hypothetical protein